MNATQIPGVSETSTHTYDPNNSKQLVQELVEMGAASSSPFPQWVHDEQEYVTRIRDHNTHKSNGNDENAAATGGVNVAQVLDARLQLYLPFIGWVAPTVNTVDAGNEEIDYEKSGKGDEYGREEDKEEKCELSIALVSLSDASLVLPYGCSVVPVLDQERDEAQGEECEGGGQEEVAWEPDWEDSSATPDATDADNSDTVNFTAAVRRYLQVYICI